MPDDLRDLLSRPLVAVCATVDEYDRPHASPLWFVATSGAEPLIKISQVREQQKYKNMMRTGWATLTIVDPDNTSRYLEVRCAVVADQLDPSRKLVKSLAARYGVPDFEGPPGTHVAVTLRPYYYTRFM